MGIENGESRFSEANSLIDWPTVEQAGESYIKGAWLFFGIESGSCPGEVGNIMRQLLHLGLNKKSFKIMGLPEDGNESRFKHVWVTFEGEIIDKLDNREKYGDMYGKGVIIKEFE